MGNCEKKKRNPKLSCSQDCKKCEHWEGFWEGDERLPDLLISERTPAWVEVYREC